MELKKILLDEYESLGLDMLVYVNNDYSKLRDLSDDLIKLLISNVTYNIKKTNPLDIDRILRLNTTLFIYNDIKNKKRIEKIKKLKKLCTTQEI